VYPMLKKIFVAGAVSLMSLLTACQANADNSVTISRKGDTVELKAGPLKRTLRVSGGKVTLESLTLAGKPLIADKANEVSFQISRATPNRNPAALKPADKKVINVKATQGDGTDTLLVKKPVPTTLPSEVKWTDNRSFAGRSWNRCFDLSNVAIVSPKPGMQRLIIRARSLKDPALAGVSVNIIYETYEGYPVIRKWVEVTNNGANWIKLSNLLIDDIVIKPEFSNKTLLTPSERGAGASVVAFSHTDKTRGVILASEIPSALRAIHDNGSSGYAAEHFEWVLGPAENFVSEPVFMYAFSGDVVKTSSAQSLPMDRAVESGFQHFLKEHLGISPAHIEVQAPKWVTWTNFGPEITDAIVREQAALAAKCGFVLFVLDDGWQKDRLGRDPNKERFPKFGETCKYVIAQGLRLGLWVSCYRSPGADDFKALPNAASTPEIRRHTGKAMSFASNWHKFYANDMVFLHDYYGATYFKQDFTNPRFGDMAPGHYSRTRKESLLRSLRGLLESQVILRRNAPSIANQITHEIYWGTPGVPCDLAALKCVSQYHIPPNDYSGAGHRKRRVGAPGAWEKYKPEELRKQLIKGCMNARNRFYAHRGLPMESIEYYGAATVNWKGSLTTQIQDRQVCSWLMGAPLVYAGDLASLSKEHIARYKLRFDLLKRLEKSYGIYRNFQYSGVPAPTDTDWHWWGKLNKQGYGAVVVIRGSGGEDQRTINIPWVQPDRKYKVTSQFQKKALGSFTGKQLQAGALSIKLPTLGQEILELSPQ
jgi:hypothetical protein